MKKLLTAMLACSLLACAQSDPISLLDSKRTYLRQVILDVDKQTYRGFPNTFSRTFLMPQLAVGEDIIPDCVLVDPRSIVDPLRLVFSGEDFHADATFLEIISDSPDVIDRFGKKHGPLTERFSIAPECSVEVRGNSKQMRLILYRKNSIKDDLAFECSAKAHLYFFGITDLDSFNDYIDRASFRALPDDAAFRFDKIRKIVQDKQKVCTG